MIWKIHTDAVIPYLELKCGDELRAASPRQLDLFEENNFERRIKHELERLLTDQAAIAYHQIGSTQTVKIGFKNMTQLAKARFQ